MLNSASLLIVPILLLTTLLMTAGQTIAQTPTPKLSGKFLNSQLATPDNIIGIGTTAPYQNVQGNVNISGETHIDGGPVGIGDKSDGTLSSLTTTQVLKFGGDGSGEGITSNRISGLDLYGLNFYTNSLNRLTILNDGRIGINNILYSWPSAQGAASTVLTNNGSGTLTWAPSSGGGSVGPGTTNYVSKFNAAGNNVINSQLFDNGTNMGIGTATPGDKLHLLGGNPRILTESTGGWTGLRMKTPAHEYFVGIEPGSLAPLGAFQIYDNTSSAVRLWLTPSGNFGINTTSPGQKFSVNGTFGIMGTSATNTFQTSGVQAASVTYILPTNGGAVNQVLTTNGTGTLSWTTISGGGSSLTIQDEGINLTQRATLNFAGAGVTCIDNAGSTRTDCTIPGGGGSLPSGTINQTLRHDGTTWVANSFLYNNGTAVGINTTSPAAGVTLDVNGKAKMTGFQLGSTATSGYVLTADASGNGIWQAPPAGGGGSLPNGTAPGQTPYWNGASWQVNGNLTNLGPSGNIGIGTASPNQKLSVNGTLGIIGSFGTNIFQTSSSQVGNVTYSLPNSAGSSGQVLTTNGTGTLSWTTVSGGGGLPPGSSGQTLRHDGTNWIANSNLYNNGTNIGVGTITPGAKLQINAPAATEALRLITDSFTSPLNIRNSGNTADIFRVDQSGILQVGNIPWARLSSFPTACPVGQFVTTVGLTLTCATPPAGGGGLGGSGTLNYVAKFTPNGTTLGNSQIFDNGTNIGIGTATPAVKLDVNGSIQSNKNIYVQSPIPNYAPYTNAVVGTGELRQALLDYPSPTTAIFGIGWDSATPGAVGILMPADNFFGIYGYGGSGTAGFRVSGMTYLNQGLKLGPETTGINATPGIDFHYMDTGMGSTQDYNARIINGGNNTLDLTTNAATTLGKIGIRVVNEKVGIGLWSSWNPNYTLDVLGDVNATRLCIAGVCQSTWPNGGGAVSSVAASNTTLTISPTTGAVLASLNLANANTWTGAQTFNANTNFGGRLISTVATGTAPLSISSTTAVTNLNADMVDGMHASSFMAATTDNWINTTGDTMSGALTVNNSLTVSGTATTLAGNTIVDSGNTNAGTWNNVLKFGGSGSGEGIASKRDTGGNQWGLDFYTNSTNRISISSAGFVGIGTVAPITTLDIYTPTQTQGMRMTGPNAYATVFSANLTASNFNPITQLNDAGIFFGKGLAPDDPAMAGFVIGPWSNTLSGIRIDKTGNVSIGTANAQGKKLYVNGDATFTGNVLYGTAGPISDARLKKNIQPLKNALGNLLQLEGLNFEFDLQKDPNLPKGQNIGFIAQQVEPIVPEVVRTDSKGYKSVLYENLTALLVEAVKDLNNQVSTIFTKVNQHDSQITKQQQMIDTQAKQIEQLHKEVEALKTK